MTVDVLHRKVILDIFGQDAIRSTVNKIFTGNGKISRYQYLTLIKSVSPLGAFGLLKAGFWVSIEAKRGPDKDL
jgi:hypothetical protein